MNGTNEQRTSPNGSLTSENMGPEEQFSNRIILQFHPRRKTNEAVPKSKNINKEFLDVTSESPLMHGFVNRDTGSSVELQELSICIQNHVHFPRESAHRFYPILREVHDLNKVNNHCANINVISKYLQVMCWNVYVNTHFQSVLRIPVSQDVYLW